MAGISVWVLSFCLLPHGERNPHFLAAFVKYETLCMLQQSEVKQDVKTKSLSCGPFYRAVMSAVEVEPQTSLRLASDSGYYLVLSLFQ